MMEVKPTIKAERSLTKKLLGKNNAVLPQDGGSEAYYFRRFIPSYIPIYNHGFSKGGAWVITNYRITRVAPPFLPGSLMSWFYGKTMVALKNVSPF